MTRFYYAFTPADSTFFVYNISTVLLVLDLCFVKVKRRNPIKSKIKSAVIQI
jgi:hypothetical protein